MFAPVVNSIDSLGNNGNLYYQHDGAPPHYTISVRNWLDNNFPERWIGRGGPIHWASRSPDLNPCDYFLWGYLKHKVYGSKIDSLEHLVQRITEEASNINPEHLISTFDNFKKRIDLCLSQNGKHFEHLL